MTLYDLSMVMADNFTVVIYGNDCGDELAIYDGTDYLNEAYKDCEVLDIYPSSEHELCVCIDDSEVVLDDDDEDFDME